MTWHRFSRAPIENENFFLPGTIIRLPEPQNWNWTHNQNLRSLLYNIHAKTRKKVRDPPTLKLIIKLSRYRTCTCSRPMALAVDCVDAQIKFVAVDEDRIVTGDNLGNVEVRRLWGNVEVRFCSFYFFFIFFCVLAWKSSSRWIWARRFLHLALYKVAVSSWSVSNRARSTCWRRLDHNRLQAIKFKLNYKKEV